MIDNKLTWRPHNLDSKLLKFIGVFYKLSWHVSKTGGKLVLITNRKSYVSFRLVPKSMTLNDLEQRNGRYIALFHWIW